MPDKEASLFQFPRSRLQTVSELTSSIRGLLETSFPFVAVVGQISDLRQAPSGHYYLVLKDEQAQIRAVIFRQQQRYLLQAPANGLEVICRGRVSVYEPRGEYQLLIDSLEARGTGELQIAFERLKRRLEEEGLFAPSAKRPLPYLPERIALVTSPRGAAVHDFLRVAARRFPSIPIEILPARMQGAGAAEEIVAALQLASERGTAQMIAVLCRGGGSLEDLQPFNDERVARAIRASRIPVVSAVGHEVDFTIADLAADYRASTPTAAAEAVMPDRGALKIKVAEVEHCLSQALQRKIGLYGYRVETHKRLLGDPSRLLAHFLLLLDHRQAAMVNAFLAMVRGRQDQVMGLRSRLLERSPVSLLQLRQHTAAALEKRLAAAAPAVLAGKRLGLGKAAALLHAVSPLAVLGRGYAIVRTLPDRRVVRASTQVHSEEEIEVLLSRGSLRCRVTEARDGEKAGE